jgi:hypothetical protein
VAKTELYKEDKTTLDTSATKLFAETELYDPENKQKVINRESKKPKLEQKHIAEQAETILSLGNSKENTYAPRQIAVKKQVEQSHVFSELFYNVASNLRKNIEVGDQSSLADRAFTKMFIIILFVLIISIIAFILIWKAV